MVVAFLCLQTSGQPWLQALGQGGATNRPLLPNPPGSSSGEDLPPETLDLILRFNDAVQEHLSTPGGGQNHGRPADPGSLRQQGQQGLLVPSGIREPVQNTELGDDVPDSLGWETSEEDEDTYRA